MGFLDKLAFWKRQPELPELGDLGKESGFKGPGGFGEAGFGKPREPGGAGFDQLGLGKEQDLMGEVEPGMPEIEPGYGGGPGMPQRPLGMQQRQPQRQQWPQQPQQQPGAPMTPIQPAQREYIMSKDIEIVSSKLDALKATLDGINQRLANLERLAQDKKRW
jgi:hypothetical protein